AEEREGDLSGMIGAEDEREGAATDSLALHGEPIELRQRDTAGLHLLLDGGGLRVTDDARQRSPRDGGKPRVTRRRLLARLHDGSQDLRLDQGVLRLRLVNGHVDDQARRLVLVEKRIQFAAEGE